MREMVKRTGARSRAIDIGNAGEALVLAHLLAKGFHAAQPYETARPLAEIVMESPTSFVLWGNTAHGGAAAIAYSRMTKQIRNVSQPSDVF
jgi:hypothetical protein